MSKKMKTAAIFVIALLCMSLGFNGYFIQEEIKGKRKASIDRGKSIILDYYDAKMFTGIVHDAVSRLLEHDSLKQRLDYQQSIGMAYRFNHAIPSLMNRAEDIKGEPFKAMAYSPRFIFIEINNGLAGIASHTGELSEDEVAYLTAVRDLFGQAQGLLEGYAIENTADELALQMLEGGKWIEIVEQINDLFADSPDIDFLFTYRANADNE